MTLTYGSFEKISLGSVNGYIGTVNADSSYATGGYSLDKTRFGASQIKTVLCLDPSAGWVPGWEESTQKLKFYGAAGGSYSFQGSALKVSRSYSMTHDGTPGGNSVFLKTDTSGHIYLCCDMATTTADKLVQFVSGGAMKITHDAGAGTGTPVYFDEDGVPSQQKLFADMTALTGAGNDAYLLTSDGSVVWVAHSATPASLGVVFNYDDGVDQRIEFISPTTSNANLSTHPNIAWAAGVPGGTVSGSGASSAEAPNTTDLTAVANLPILVITK